jgi:wobble nucleotide-excising tRNase
VDTGSIEKRIASLNAQKKRHEPAVVAAFAAFDAATTSKAEKEKAKVAANNALREQSEQVLTDYGGLINALLDRFKVGFRLVSGGVNFRGGPPAGELAVEILGTRVSTTPEDARNPALPSLANTLSGGDRSALGLAYFVAVAERDPDISNTILAFDDPFHSQDRSRRRRTIECVHRLAALSRQCFILSHELDFAREAARMAGVQVNTFTLDPMIDHSLLEAKSLPPLPGRAYEQDYAKLTAYLRSPAEFADQLKDVARCIRQSLEGYMRTKFPEAWAADDWIGGMIGKIRDAQPGDVLHHAAHLVTDLTEVNDWGKRYYHGETDGSDAGAVDATELNGYVEQTIAIISR